MGTLEEMGKLVEIVLKWAYWKKWVLIGHTGTNGFENGHTGRNMGLNGYTCRNWF